MGMPVSIHLRGDHLRDRAPDREAAVAAVEQAVAQAFSSLREVDEVFSTWKAGSQVSRLARGELDLADCALQVRDVVRLCAQARRLTDGWFDADAAPDGAGGRRFDPTGLVKGWAVQRTCAALAEALPEHGVLVNAGGDIAAWCAQQDAEPWRLGIEDPSDRTRILATVELRSGGLATSGTAARGAHIYRPATGSPADGLASVSVIGPSLMWADVYATAAFARGADCVEWLRTLDGYTWLVVALDGSTTTG